MSETADPKETCGFCSRLVESGITIDDEFYHVHCACEAMPRSIGEELSRRADDITRLKSVIQSLVEAVTPFAAGAEIYEQDFLHNGVWGRLPDSDVVSDLDCVIKVGDLRRALEAKTKAEEALKGETL